MGHFCPICGWPELTEPPRSEDCGGSYEICPSCGFQFGVDDDDRGFTYADWRERWMQAGMKWWSQSRPAPPGWNPSEQLQTAPINPSEPA